MRSTASRLIVLALAVLALVLAATVLRVDPTPYVVTAIDYHFHDAHPTRPLVQGQDFAVENQGSNVHNVTIPALGFSEDVEPGDRITIEDIADRLEPGRHELFCAIHKKGFGMVGVIVIAGD